MCQSIRYFELVHGIILPIGFTYNGLLVTQLSEAAYNILVELGYRQQEGMLLRFAAGEG
jgi:hypothetical protein